MTTTPKLTALFAAWNDDKVQRRRKEVGGLEKRASYG